MEVTVSTPRGLGPLRVSDSSESSVKQDRHCQPCTIDDAQIIAVGYCSQCNEFMCIHCIKYHRKTKLTKSHAILEGDDMPEAPLAEYPITTDNYEICAAHSSPDLPLVVKFYCGRHDEVGCGDCMVLDHNSSNCSAKFIKDVAKTFDVDQELATIQGTLASVDSEVKDCEKAIQQVYEANVRTDEKATEAVSEFMKKMIEYIIRNGKEILNEISDKKETNERDRKVKIRECLKVKEEIVEVRDQLESRPSGSNNEFVAVKRSKSVIQQIQERIQDIETDTATKRRNNTFLPNPALTTMLNSWKPLGTTKDISKATLTHIGDINIKSEDDRNFRKSYSWISGMALISSDTLVIADYHGNAVIVVDLRTNMVVASNKMPCAPWDVAVLPDNDIAVTLRDKKRIQILRFENRTLSRYRHFYVTGRCYGIDYSNNRLVVTYEKGLVEIMELYGNVIKRINPGVFRHPEYAAFSKSGESILVSDGLWQSVTRLSADGKVLGKYELNKGVNDVGGIFCCRDDTFLVCAKQTDNIQVLSQDGSPLGVIHDKNDSLRDPLVAVVSDDMETMYVGCPSHNVNVYKLTYK